MTTDLTRPAGAQTLGPAVGTWTTWARFLLGFLLQWAVLAGASAQDPTARWGPAVLAAVTAASLAVSAGLYGSDGRAAVRALGLGRPSIRALAVAVVVSGLVLLVWPLTARLSGAAVSLRPGWPVLLVGVFALHGLAEEVVWRGYAFRRLAQGRRYWPAALWTMPLIAATHVPILVTAGPVIGGGAMLVAAVTSIPLSRLYVMGGNTVWAPALLHTAIDSFKLMVVPAAALAIYPVLVIGFSLTVPLLVLLVPATPRRQAGPDVSASHPRRIRDHRKESR